MSEEVVILSIAIIIVYPNKDHDGFIGFNCQNLRFIPVTIPYVLYMYKYKRHCLRKRTDIFILFKFLLYTYVPKIFSTNGIVRRKPIYQDVVRGLHLLFGNSGLTLVINLILRRKTPLNLGISIKLANDEHPEHDSEEAIPPE